MELVTQAEHQQAGSAIEEREMQYGGLRPGRSGQPGGQLPGEQGDCGMRQREADQEQGQFPAGVDRARLAEPAGEHAVLAVGDDELRGGDDGSDDENRRMRPWYGQVQTLEEPDVEGPGLITAPDNTQYLVVKDATGKSLSIPVSLAKQIPYFGEMLEDGGLSIDRPFLLPNGTLMKEFGHAVNYLSNPEAAVEMYEKVADRSATCM